MTFGPHELDQAHSAIDRIEQAMETNPPLSTDQDVALARMLRDTTEIALPEANLGLRQRLIEAVDEQKVHPLATGQGTARSRIWWLLVTSASLLLAAGGWLMTESGWNQLDQPANPELLANLEDNRSGVAAAQIVIDKLTDEQAEGQTSGALEEKLVTASTWMPMV